MSKRMIISLLVTFLMLPFPQRLLGKDAEPKRLKSKVSLGYYKSSDNSKELRIVVTAKEEKKYLPEPKVVVHVIMINGEDSAKIGSFTSNSEGEIMVRLGSDLPLFQDSTGVSTFYAFTDGTDRLKAASRKVDIRDLTIQISGEVVDSINMVKVEARYLNGMDSLPLEEQDIYLYVPRLLSLLPVGEGWLEKGQCQIEFPSDIPGGEDGALSVIARLEDSDEFGNVEAIMSVDWGKSSHREGEVGSNRELWTDSAPLWMVITLICLLSAVWLHFLIILFKLYVIKHHAKYRLDN